MIRILIAVFAINWQRKLFSGQKKCHKLFCSKCSEHYKKVSVKNGSAITKCPFCRTQPFQTFESHFRMKINNIKQKCRYCKKQYKISQIQQHQSKLCQEQAVVCKICFKTVKKKDIVIHTKDLHKQTMPQIIRQFQFHRIPIHNPEEVLIKYVKDNKNYGKIPHIGTNGKFYCGGPLGLLCNCCNGLCGPTNGQNCLKCMKLDMIRKGLSRGYLVNGGGEVCWKDNDDNFMCCVMFSLQKKICGTNQNYCKFCTNTTINQQRYKDLIQK